MTQDLRHIPQPPDRRPGAIEPDCHDIEAVGAGAEAGQRLTETAFLFRGEGEEGIVTHPGLHFDGDDLARQGDQEIDLTGAGTHIATEHPGAAALQESAGDELAETP
jgi:hypothetical protein